MPEPLLQLERTDPTLRLVGGKGVAQAVGADFLGDARGLEVLGEHLPDTAFRDGFTLVVEKELAMEAVWPHPEVAADRLDPFLLQLNRAALPPLAVGNAQGAIFIIEILKCQRTELTDANPVWRLLLQDRCGIMLRFLVNEIRALFLVGLIVSCRAATSIPA